MQISNLSNNVSGSNYVGIKVSSGNTMINKKDDKDSLFISDQARHMFRNNGRSDVNSSIELLMKQRENLMENKNKLLEKTLESGAELDTIKDRMKDMDEQIRLLEQQISQQQLDGREKALGRDDESQKISELDKEPKTEQELQAGELHNIVQLAGSLDQVEHLSAQKGKMEGEMSVLKSEIALDGDRSSTHKYEKVADLNKGIAEIGQQIAEIGDSITGKLKDEMDLPGDIIKEESDSSGLNEENNANQLDLIDDVSSSNS